MKRLTMLVPIVTLAAACADEGPVGPVARVPSPSMDVVFETGPGVTITFDEGSHCFYDEPTDVFECKYTVENLDPARTYEIWVAGLYHVRYECVNPKSGKASRKLGIRFSDEFVGNEIVVQGAASYSAELDLSGPPDLHHNYCSLFRGSFTDYLITGAGAYGWVIFVYDADNFDNWAQLEGSFD